MNYIDFEKEIKELDPRFSIVQNINRRADNGNSVGLCNIFFEGMNYDLPPIPEEIKDTPDHAYKYIFPNGYMQAMYSKEEVLERLKDFLNKFEKDNLRELYNEK